ncbi:Ppx/GppA phosphatase family protein [Reinekea sp.]|jgi:exopolyphosphatase/guanosine-5'-triphosphate,3'-diphosphate pyrophosphatase|uniref:Ppx/GppA phosphatase family protein n=1 Tax=Reinekea sp. TaxID=1970455 RepID=UPI002A8229CF|nr:Ppx/GppA phosphatase family protein [Reinekea sp.]
MLKISGFWRNRDEEFAAIDLGSNSFHMIIAKVSNGQLTIIDRLKESVLLGYGLDDGNCLDDISQQRALDCLERFQQRIAHLPSARVRAIGTRTLRLAVNAAPFLIKAEQTLGVDIHIVSGAEEARLVYQGVAFGIEDDHLTRLVIDIGGGSTELIVGQDFMPSTLESLGMGCVSVTKRFFPKGEMNKAAIKAADIYCLQKIEPFQSMFRKQSWQRTIGCSGTIKTIASILDQITGHPAITPDGLDLLIKHCLEARSIETLNLPGLSNDRRPVFVGGLIVLRACMQALKLRTLEASPWALREGVLFDLLGYDSISDMRERSVTELGKRFHTDAFHAQRTQKVAQQLFKQVQKKIDLDDSWLSYMSWACLLQEVGLDINHDQFHIHGGYIIEHSHLAGFGYDEQNRLAYLVRNQRKKPNWTVLEKLPEEDVAAFVVVLQLFRLACILTRARNEFQDIGWSISVEERELVFNAPQAWWEAQPLATAGLMAEAHFMKKGPGALKLNQPAAEED